MSIVENKNLNPELVANVHEDLQPTKERIMGSLSYTASFLGGCVSIGTFSMGASLIGVLTITQAILAMAIGCLVIAVALVLIGNCGHKYGIPYIVQLRSSFGTAGVKIPGVLRGLPAIVWFGFQGWCRCHQQLLQDSVGIRQSSGNLCTVHNPAGFPGN